MNWKQNYYKRLMDLLRVWWNGGLSLKQLTFCQGILLIPSVKHSYVKPNAEIETWYKLAVKCRIKANLHMKRMGAREEISILEALLVEL